MTTSPGLFPRPAFLPPVSGAGTSAPPRGSPRHAARSAARTPTSVLRKSCPFTIICVPIRISASLIYQVRQNVGMSFFFWSCPDPCGNTRLKIVFTTISICWFRLKTSDMRRSARRALYRHRPYTRSNGRPFSVRMLADAMMQCGISSPSAGTAGEKIRPPRRF